MKQRSLIEANPHYKQLGEAKINHRLTIVNSIAVTPQPKFTMKNDLQPNHLHLHPQPKSSTTKSVTTPTRFTQLKASSETAFTVSITKIRVSPSTHKSDFSTDITSIRKMLHCCTTRARQIAVCNVSQGIQSQPVSRVHQPLKSQN